MLRFENGKDVTSAFQDHSCNGSSSENASRKWRTVIELQAIRAIERVSTISPWLASVEESHRFFHGFFRKEVSSSIHVPLTA